MIGGVSLIERQAEHIPKTRRALITAGSHLYTYKRVMVTFSRLSDTKQSLQHKEKPALKKRVIGACH